MLCIFCSYSMEVSTIECSIKASRTAHDATAELCLEIKLWHRYSVPHDFHVINVLIRQILATEFFVITF